MKWQDFRGLQRPVVTRGTLFRFPAKWPYEDVVEFMLILTPWADSNYGFVVSSGYKSGHLGSMLPYEANINVYKPGSNWDAISTEWLQKNWRKWVYDVPTSKVKVSIGHPPKPRLPK